MKTDIQKLLQEHAHLFEQHQCHVCGQDYASFETKLRCLLQIWEIETVMYSICDFNHKNFLYFSPKLSNLLGYGSAIDWAPGKPNSFYPLIHPDDLAFVLETEMMVHDFLHGLPPEEKQKYKLVYDYRIRTAKSCYLRLMHRTIPLERDKFGNTWLAVVASELLSNGDDHEKPRRYLLNKKTGEQCLFNNGNCPKSSQVLTAREREILSLIIQGKDSQYISNQLFISSCTVNNHRQNILCKTRTNNMPQATNLAKFIGCI